MISSLANITAIVIVGFLAWRWGRDRRVGSVRSARGLRIAGLIPLGLQVAFFLLFGLGEMADGDPSGVGHLLLPAAPIVLLAILAWMRPLEGGIALFAGGALFVLDFIVGVVTSGPIPESAEVSPALMIIAAPQMLSGLLFFIAGLLARGTTTPGADQGR